MHYKIGADPELFIFNRREKVYVSAHNLIPGSKQEPFKVDKGAIQVDGTAAEFNILPAETLGEFSDNIFSVLNELIKKISDKNPDYELAAIPSVTFHPKYFRTLPLTAKALGCQPDYDAYTSQQNTITRPKKPFRTGAGHLHVGWTERADEYSVDHYMKCEEFVRQLDVVLYMTSLLWDKDNERRTLYGKIGAFRPKSYGVEYRCLSNAWVFDQRLHRHIFLSAVKAADLYDTGVNLFEIPRYADLVRRVREGENLEREEVLDHYADLLSSRYCEPLPDVYIKD